MATNQWLACGQRWPRLELLGTVQADATNQGRYALHDLQGIRIAVEEAPYVNGQPAHHDPAASIEAAVIKPFAFLNLPLRRLLLATPLPVDSTQRYLTGLPSTGLIWEGLEHPQDRLLDLVAVRGWQLSLRQHGPGRMEFELLLHADWEMNGLPGYLPGYTQGEASLRGWFGAALLPQDRPLCIAIAWPFSLEGRLVLEKPYWTGADAQAGRWRANLDAQAAGALFDGAGTAFRDFPFGKIDVAGLVQGITDLGELIDDYLFLEAGYEGDTPTFTVEISTPESFEIAEFAGFRLILKGRAALAMVATFQETALCLRFEIRLAAVSSNGGGTRSAETAIILSGPIIRKLQDYLNAARQIAALLPPASGVPQLPEVDFKYVFDSLPQARVMGEVCIPLQEGALPTSLIKLDFLKELEIPADALQRLNGVQMGDINGQSPAVMLRIDQASNYQSMDGTEIGLDLEVTLAFVAFDQPLELRGDWRMLLDLETLSFAPAAFIRLRAETDRLAFKGLEILGLSSLQMDWRGQGLRLQASNLQAYFTGISDPTDRSRGFQLVVDQLTIDAGGIDLDAHLQAGEALLEGIGDVFQGASASIRIRDNIVTSASLKVTGALPWWENATGGLEFIFGPGFDLVNVIPDFEFSLYAKPAWWVELKLESIRVRFDLQGGKKVPFIMITGEIIFSPSSSGDSPLSFLKAVKLEIVDLVLTKAFDKLPAGLKLVIELPKKPDAKKLLGAFDFDLRSIGISSSQGEGALTIGGQVYFGSDDSTSTDIEFHGLKIRKPRRNSLIPRMTLEHLKLITTIKDTLTFMGAVTFFDDEGYKGFKGEARLLLEGSYGFHVLVEFSRAIRESDQKKLRIWMVNLQVENLDLHLSHGFYLRDVGLGFGWRKTLLVLDQPDLVLNPAQDTSVTIAPHRHSSWANFLEGKNARWTLVFSAWVTFGLGPRNLPSLLMGDLLFALRSDLTIIAALRGWVFNSLDKIKYGSLGSQPVYRGLLYMNPKKQHIKAGFVVDPSGAQPEGLPPQLIQSIIAAPFSLEFEYKKGYSRQELGWPIELPHEPFPGVIGKVGLLMIARRRFFLLGMGLQLGFRLATGYSARFGPASFGAALLIYAAIYGRVIVRLGTRAALYGTIGLNAGIKILAYLVIKFRIKLGFTKITIRLRFRASFQLFITARLEFGLSKKGFGIAGHAAIGIKVGPLRISLRTSFAINGGAVATARAWVGGGSGSLGPEEEVRKPIPLMPAIQHPLPALGARQARWRCFYVQRGQEVYVLLLPEKEAAFAGPAIHQISSEQEYEGQNYQRRDYDYRYDLETDNIASVWQGTEQTLSGESHQLKSSLDWNLPLLLNGQEQVLGSLFFEPEAIREEHRLLEATVEAHQPDLLVDKRVRATGNSNPRSAYDAGHPEGLRSPKFEAEDTLYDLALEHASQNAANATLSWQQIAIGHTDWTQQIISEERQPVLAHFLEGAGDSEDDDLLEQIRQEPDPGDQASHDHWRKELLQVADSILSARSTLSHQLMLQFRDWSRGRELEETDLAGEDLRLLANSGLAFRFRIQDPNKTWKIRFRGMTVALGKEADEEQQFDQLTEAQISQGCITADDSGLGFGKAGFDYRIKEVLEFQDTEGLHFSWLLECRDDKNNIYELNANGASGVGSETQLEAQRHFEFLDHFRVERINLSRNELNEAPVLREVSPGFMPALQDMGGDEQRFYLLVPRFNYSDLFSADQNIEGGTAAGEVDIPEPEGEPTPPVSVGDELLYRITAIDIFGNASQTTELITSRRHLDPPPAPAKGTLRYELQLAANEAPQETLDIYIALQEQAATWEGAAIYYEIWTRSKPMTGGGFFGTSDGEGSDAVEQLDEEPLLQPESMTLLLQTKDLHIQVADGQIKQLAYGQLHAFYLRAKTESGSCSRLIRCENELIIKLRGEEAEQKKVNSLYLERIPPPAPEAIAWLQPEEVRYQIDQRNSLRYSGNPEAPLAYAPPSSPEQRELLLRFLHPDYLDAARHYTVAAYQLYVRDRDSSTHDHPDYYNKLATIGVVLPEVYTNTPANSDMNKQWVANYLQAGEAPASRLVEEQPGSYYIDWGEALPLQAGGISAATNEPDAQQTQPLLEEGMYLHQRLLDWLQALDQHLQAQGASLQLEGGPATAETWAKPSLSKLLADYASENDPDGSLLLKALGRMADISIETDGEAPAFADLYTLLQSTHAALLAQDPGWQHYQPALELALNGDRSSQMAWYRISLLPLIRFYPKDPNSTTNWEQETYLSMAAVLHELVDKSNLEGFPGLGKGWEGLQALSQRYTARLPLAQPGQLRCGVCHYLNEGNYARPRQADGALFVNIPYNTEYARRYAYGLLRVSRYHELYQALGYFNATNLWAGLQGNALHVRFPRVKAPAPPVMQFKGNFWRGDILCSEWFVAEHGEEAKVQANESLRNVLGYRGMAWSLFAKVAPGLREGSGWLGEENWLNPSTQVAEGLAGLSQAERATLAADAQLNGQDPLPAGAGLYGHPFTELLGPKGMIIRIPKLPFYYHYSLAAFSRCDDIDSAISQTDAARVLPSIMPALQADKAGFQISGPEALTIWWQLPSLWDSLDAAEQVMWQAEKPFASRLWDFDISYTLSLNRNQCLRPQLHVAATHWDLLNETADFNGQEVNRPFRIGTNGNRLFFANQGQLEQGETTYLRSAFHPQIRLQVNTDPTLIATILAEDDFHFELSYQRTYGRYQSGLVRLYRKPIPS